MVKLPNVPHIPIMEGIVSLSPEHFVMVPSKAIIRKKSSYAERAVISMRAKWVVFINSRTLLHDGTVLIRT